MRIIALLIGVILCSGSGVAALDQPGQAVPPATPEALEGLPYTGIIKNSTRYEVSIPSDNSDAALVIPPHGWTEYIIWTKRLDVTAFHNGKPFYCLKIQAQPKNYQFMCSKYDFMAEIVKPEPVRKYKPVKKKRIKRRPKRVEGEESLG